MDGSTGGIFDKLRQIVGPKGVIDDAEAMAPYLAEQRGLYRGATPIVLRPASTAEVAAIVKLCAAAKIRLVPHS